MKALLALGLVIRQLRHEWLSTACLCVALSAALVPLLLVLGVKEGTVATLRQRLASDPANLEVRVPFPSGTLTPEKIDAISSLPETGFCIPCTRLTATAAYLDAGNGATAETNLFPTAENDPVLKRYGAPAPGKGEIVLSHSLGKKLQVGQGGTVAVYTVRQEGGRPVRAEERCRVVAVLPEACDTGVQSFVPVSLVIGVEEFLEGCRRTLDAASSTVEVHPVFYGVGVDVVDASDKVRPGLWNQVCPYREKRSLTPEDAAWNAEPLQGDLYFNQGNFQKFQNLKRLRNELRNCGGTVYLWNPPLQTRATRPGMPDSVVCVRAGLQAPDSYTDTPDWCAESSDPALQGDLILRFPEGGSVGVHVSLNEAVPEGVLATSAATLGAMYHAKHKGAEWNPAAGCFTRGEFKFTRIRLYAKDLDSVEPLVAKMEALGYRATGGVAAIRRVKTLDRQLETLFVLLAAIGVAGAACSLALSLFNSVLKRRREYAIMATLGFSRTSLSLFPVLESLLLMLASLALSFAAYGVMARVVGHLFADVLGEGERICHLPTSYIVCVTVSGLLVGLVAAAAAAVAVLRSQPSTAIREI